MVEEVEAGGFGRASLMSFLVSEFDLALAKYTTLANDPPTCVKEAGNERRTRINREVKGRMR